MNSTGNSAPLESDPGDTTLCLDGLDFIQAEGCADDDSGVESEDYDAEFDEIDFE